MNDRAVEILRTFLTVVGIMLLVIFGSRAAAQARNMKLAGATHQSIFAVGGEFMNLLGLKDVKATTAGPQQPIASQLPVTKAPDPAPQASSQTTETPVATAHATNQSVSSVATSKPKTDEGLHKAVGSVNNVSNQAQQTVNNVVQNTSNDFMDLWP